MGNRTLDEFVRPDSAPAESESEADGDVAPADEGDVAEIDDLAVEDGVDANPDEDGVDANPDEDGTDVSPDEDGAEAVDAAVVTYDWTPGGAVCADCGASVGARWRDDGVGDGVAMVCADCKDW